MAVYDYTENKHPGGFTGFRVCRSVPSRGSIQRYFRKHQRAEAYAFDAKLAAQQKKEGGPHRPNVFPDPLTAPPMKITRDTERNRAKLLRATGVRNLTLTLRQSDHGRWHPTILIESSSKRYGQIRTSLNIGRRDQVESWRLACQKLADHYELKRVPRKWYNQIPTRKQWLALRRHYIKNLGHHVPICALDVVPAEAVNV